MYDKIKEFVKKHWKIICVIVLCFVVIMIGVSCSSIGDGSTVQFGLTNDNLGDFNTLIDSDL